MLSGKFGCSSVSKPTFIPRDYQSRIIDKIHAGDAWIIALMGAGKTASTLEAIKNLPGQTLVIAPLRVASHTWPAEIDKWANFANLDYAVATGPLAKRQLAVRAHKSVTIINRENIPWLLDYIGKKDWPYSTIVVDESSSFKNPQSKRFKALKKVVTITKKVVLLTGTPAPNSLLELWSQMFLIDQGQALGKTYSDYRNRFFTVDYMGYNFELRDGAQAKIEKLIAPRCLVVESYIGLPARADLIESVALSKTVMKRYSDFENDCLETVDNVTSLTAVNAAVLAGKLLQIAGGAVYGEDREVQFVHDTKILALESIVEQCEGENILVAYNYKHEAERIKERFPNAESIKAPGAIDRWNRGEIKMMLAHPASAGHGLNLQAGGNRIVWFSPTWSNELKLQFDARLQRLGQSQPVFIHTIIAEGTIDEDVLAALETKQTIQQIIINKLRGIK